MTQPITLVDYDITAVLHVEFIKEEVFSHYIQEAFFDYRLEKIRPDA